MGKRRWSKRLYHPGLKKLQYEASFPENQSQFDSDYSPTKNLPKDKTLYWRVKAKGDNGPSDWSEIWSVSTFLSLPALTSQTFAEDNLTIPLPEPEVIQSGIPFNLQPIEPKNIAELSTLEFSLPIEVSGSAPTLSYSLSGAPEGAVISPEGNFSWTPTEAQGPGVYQFDICANDGITNDCENVMVAVDEVNAAPSLENIGSLSAEQETELSLNAAATDADVPVQPLIFSLSGGPELAPYFTQRPISLDA